MGFHQRTPQRLAIVPVAAWIAGMAACGAPPAAAQHAVMTPDSVELAMGIEPRPGGAARTYAVSLDVTNRGSQPVTLAFGTSQRYDLMVANARGEEVWRWSADMMFAQMLGEEQLGPGESLTFLEVTPALQPGRYTVVGQLTSVSHPLQVSATLDAR